MFCCERPLTAVKWQCGHIVSKKNGGFNIIENLRPICKTCNLQMLDTHMYEFMIMRNMPGLSKVIDDPGFICVRDEFLTGRSGLDLRETKVTPRVIKVSSDSILDRYQGDRFKYIHHNRSIITTVDATDVDMVFRSIITPETGEVEKLIRYYHAKRIHHAYMFLRAIGFTSVYAVGKIDYNIDKLMSYIRENLKDIHVYFDITWTPQYPRYFMEFTNKLLTDSFAIRVERITKGLCAPMILRDISYEFGHPSNGVRLLVFSEVKPLQLRAAS